MLATSSGHVDLEACGTALSARAAPHPLSPADEACGTALSARRPPLNPADVEGLALCGAALSARRPPIAPMNPADVEGIAMLVNLGLPLSTTLIDCNRQSSPKAMWFQDQTWLKWRGFGQVRRELIL